MQGEITSKGLIVGGMIGQRGAPGNGIVGIEKTGESGLVDTYTITYTNGTTDTIQVTNGAKGDKGDKGDQGIQGIQGVKGDKGDKGDTGEQGMQGIQGERGEKGEQGERGERGYQGITGEKGDKGDKGDTGAKGDTGETGNGISSIEKTSTSGNVDTYTITFTDGTTTTFDVTNGEDGNVTDVQLNGTSVVDNGVANLTGLATQKELDLYKTIYSALPKVEGEGETITLDNTANAVMKNKLYPTQMSQYSTTGKNLLNVPSSYSVTGSKELNINIPSGTYICNLTSITLGGENNALLRFMHDNTELGYAYFNTTQLSKTITINDTMNKIYIYSQNEHSTSVGKTTIFNGLMISTSGGEYEPYTNGASPNPSYPQPINVVSGDNEIVVCGKNLFDDNEISNIWVQTNGAINYNATGSNAKLYEVQPGETYTLKAIFSSLSSDNVGIIAFFDSNMTLLSRNATGNELTVLISKVAPTNAKYMYAGRYMGTPTTIQLEKSSSATSYEPYQSQSKPLNLGDKEICKIGNYEDKIFKAIKGNEIYDSLSVEEKNTLDYGKWYLRKAIGKVVLNGSETGWRLFFETSGIFINSTILTSINSASTTNCKSNYYAGTDRTYIRGNLGTVNNVCATNSGELIFANKSLSTTSDFTAWLSNNNTIVYYVLATPQIIPLNETLQEQLEDIYNETMSYEGQTNISQVNNDLAFVVESSALRLIE